MAAQKTDALSNWTALNTFLLTADERASEKVLAQEQAGRNRPRFLLRIHSRINKLRAHRERKALLKKAS